MHHLFADVASGETDAADVAYLVATILAVAAAALRFSAPRTEGYGSVGGALLCLAVAGIALGLLLL
jgi:hypothetical protein